MALMNDLNQRKKLGKFLQKGVILFSGAGISISPPSEIPTTNKVNSVLIKSIFNSSDLTPKINLKAQTAVNKRFSNIRMETLFEVFLRNGFDNVLNCLTIFEKSEPNLDHFSIAQLCKKGVIKAIFTLNFDYLQEQALNKLGVSFKPFLKEEDYRLSLSTINKSFIPVFHLHNGFIPGEEQNLSHLNAATSKVKSHLPKLKSDMFIHYLKKYPILCVGYSNKDIDTFPIIATHSGTVIWYSHFPQEIEPLGEQVIELKNKKENDFIHLIRCEMELNENCFSDVLTNSFNEDILQTKELKPFIAENSPLSVEDKLEHISKFINQTISSSVKANIVLADLLDIISEREIALELITTEIGEDKSLFDYEIFSRARILRHIYERLGKSHIALNYSKDLLKYSNESQKMTYLILHAGALNGIWKKDPYRIGILIKYLLIRFRLSQRKILLTNDASIHNNYHFECGDFLDFIGSYLFYPSVIYLRLLSKFSEKLNFNKEYYLNNRLLIQLDKIIHKTLRPLFHSIQNKAITYYEKTLISKDSAPGFVYLCICRCVEILSFQKRFEEAEKYIPILKEGLNYFEWTNEVHGKGNIYLALYCFYYNQRSNQPLDDIKKYLDLAANSYGSHYSGLFKCHIIEFRMKNKILE